MKVVYVGPLNECGTCFSRLRALREIEPRLHTFDTQAFLGRLPRWKRFIEVITSCSVQFTNANSALCNLCSNVRPDVVWVDKGFWIWPSTLTRLRDGGAYLIQHNTDALWPRHWRYWLKHRLMRATLRYYDLYFTTNLYDYSRIKKAGSPRVELTYLGYDSDRFNNEPLAPQSREKWHTKLIFVGHHECRTEAGVVALVNAGLPVRVYGDGWECANRKRLLARHVTFRQLSNGEYVEAIKGAEIGLCFVSEINGNQTAGRSFEIPASGTFLLAMRTAQHCECYLEGTEAEFFADHAELVRKARYYLDHTQQRREIARKGYERCVGSDYSWARYMRDDWTKVLELMRADRLPSWSVE